MKLRDSHCVFALPQCHYNLYKHSFVLRNLFVSAYWMDVGWHCIFLVLISLLMLCYDFNLLMAFDRLLLKGLLTYLLSLTAVKERRSSPIHPAASVGIHYGLRPAALGHVSGRPRLSPRVLSFTSVTHFLHYYSVHLLWYVCIFVDSLLHMIVLHLLWLVISVGTCNSLFLFVAWLCNCVCLVSMCVCAPSAGKGAMSVAFVRPSVA